MKSIVQGTAGVSTAILAGDDEAMSQEIPARETSGVTCTPPEGGLPEEQASTRRQKQPLEPEFDTWERLFRFAEPNFQLVVGPTVLNTYGIRDFYGERVSRKNIPHQATLRNAVRKFREELNREGPLPAILCPYPMTLFSNQQEQRSIPKDFDWVLRHLYEARDWMISWTLLTPTPCEDMAAPKREFIPMYADRAWIILLSHALGYQWHGQVELVMRYEHGKRYPTPIGLTFDGKKVRPESKDKATHVCLVR